MKKIIIILIIASMSFSLMADKVYSTRTSFLLSAAIPGAGDFYRRDYLRGSISLVSELALIASLVHYGNEKDHAENSYQTFAQNTIGFSSSVESEYYDLINTQLSSDHYNENVRLNAQNYYGYGTNDYYEYVDANAISDEQSWNWESQENLDKYKNIRTRKQKYVQKGNIVVGALIVNHVYSAITSAVKTSKHNKQFLERHTLNIIPNLETQGVAINYGYKF